MEGWLQVPPERNLIGRAGWKPRYVRFNNVSQNTQRASISASSTARPTTSGSSSSGVGALVGSTLGSKRIPGLERSHSTHQVSSLASAAMAATADSRVWTLAIYKQKTDTEPVARYPIQRIASCYVGDVAQPKSKKSLVQPTLVINMRIDPPPISSSYTSSRSFRRRSSEAPPNGFRSRDSSANPLLFRLSPDLSTSTLERWSKEIQAQLLPISLPKSNTVGRMENTFRETFKEECDYDTPAPSPSSLFLVNGEPNTALLSPSIRSRTSNLSSLDSEDKISYSSSYAASEMIGSPGMDERRPQSSISDQQQRPSLHVRTNSRKGSDTLSISNSSDIMAAPGRKRETILDRFFSTAPSSPSSVADASGGAKTKPMSSIARFEALMDDLESRQADGSRILRPHDTFDEIPQRIPSPTQRALEFVSTGYRAGSSSSTSGRPETPSPKYETTTNSTTASTSAALTTLLAATPRTSAEQFSPTRSRRNSDTLSLDTLQSSYTASTGGTAGLHDSTAPNMLGPASQSKRHSVAADFSMLRLSTATPPPVFSPPVFSPTSGCFRRNSFDDMHSIGEEPVEARGRLGMETGVMEGGEFGRAAAAASGGAGGRPLFREFSF